MRPYQDEAVDGFDDGIGRRGGAGIIVLPCGAGKTVIGRGATARLQTSTLILATNAVAVHQWRDELLDKSDLAREHVGEYTGDVKQVRPVTVATYQILTRRNPPEDGFQHLDLLRQQ